MKTTNWVRVISKDKNNGQYTSDWLPNGMVKMFEVKHPKLRTIKIIKAKY